MRTASAGPDSGCAATMASRVSGTGSVGGGASAVASVIRAPGAAPLVASSRRPEAVSITARLSAASTTVPRIWGAGASDETIRSATAGPLSGCTATTASGASGTDAAGAGAVAISATTRAPGTVPDTASVMGPEAVSIIARSSEASTTVPRICGASTDTTRSTSGWPLPTISAATWRPGARGSGPADGTALCTPASRLMTSSCRRWPTLASAAMASSPNAVSIRVRPASEATTWPVNRGGS